MTNSNRPFGMPFQTAEKLVGAIITVLFFGNVYFVKQWGDRLASVENSMWAVRQEVAVMHITIEGKKACSLEEEETEVLPEETQILIKKLRIEKRTLIRYMKEKIIANDFHAVADAAMDIREIDSKIEVLQL